MDIFQIYIKSHCEAPDYEDTCLAKNKREAVGIFLNRINRQSEEGWSRAEISKSVQRRDKRK